MWRCATCGDTQPIDTVVKVVRDAENFIRNNVGADVDTDVLERTIWALEKTFHPKHFLLAQVRLNQGSTLINFIVTISVQIKLVLLTKYSLVSHMSVPVIERVVQLGEELASLNLTLDTVYSNVLRYEKKSKNKNKHSLLSGQF